MGSSPVVSMILQGESLGITLADTVFHTGGLFFYLQAGAAGIGEQQETAVAAKKNRADQSSALSIIHCPFPDCFTPYNTPSASLYSSRNVLGLTPYIPPIDIDVWTLGYCGPISS